MDKQRNVHPVKVVYSISNILFVVSHEGKNFLAWLLHFTIIFLEIFPNKLLLNLFI